MAKAPKPRPEPKPGLIVTLDDESWVFRAGEVTPIDVRDLRKACGATLGELLKALSDGSMDIDYAAGLVMLARRQHEGRWVTYDHVAQSMTYDSNFKVEVEESPGEDSDDSPEASGAG